LLKLPHTLCSTLCQSLQTESMRAYITSGAHRCQLSAS
jgi:hypothetical protein